MSLKKLIKDIENLEKYLNMFIDNYAKCVTIKDTMCDVSGYYPKKFIMEVETKYIKVVKPNDYYYEKRTIYSDNDMTKFDKFKNKHEKYVKSHSFFINESKQPIMYKLINEMLRVSEIGGKVRCVYSNEEEDVLEIINNKDEIKKRAETFNEEHIIPAGIYSHAMPIVYDLHNVFPCKQEINKARSNYVFADNRKCHYNETERMSNEHVKIYENTDFYKYINLKDEKNEKQEKFNQIPYEKSEVRIPLAAKLKTMNNEIKKYENKYGSQCDFGKCYIIPYKNRGMIARSILYFHYIYWRNKNIEQIFNDSELDNHNGKDVFTKFEEEYRSFMGDKWEVLRLAIKWHLKDAPDKYEINRNNKINNLQGNKNPFIYESFTERLDSLKLIIK